MSLLSTLAARLRRPRLRDRLLLLAVGGVSLCLPACLGNGNFSILGYSTEPNYDCHLHTIRVPIFNNRTYYRELEFELTRAVVTAIEQNTPYKVVSGDADMEISGSIMAYGKSDILQNPLNEVRDAETTLTVDLVWKNLRTGEILSKPRNRPPGPGDPEVVPGIQTPGLPAVPVGPRAPGSLDQPATLIDPNAPPGTPPLPLPPTGPAMTGSPFAPKGVIVRASATFVPELGQSNTTARQVCIKRMANSITQLMEKPW